MMWHILLIGVLSMFFAEVCSGASQLWFASIWGLTQTFWLYLTHVLFFWYIANRQKRTSLLSLYLYGMIFGLYESWLTKVLWSGYMHESGPGLGTFAGVAWSEYGALVFFFHPIMSFIVPLLVYQILTGKIILEHATLLKKTSKKTWIICIYTALIATFIANGNQFSPISANLSVLGSILLILLFKHFTTKDVLSLVPSNKWFYIIVGYLILLYGVMGNLLLHERLPTEVLPYVTIILSYVVFIYLISRTSQKETKLINLPAGAYTTKDLLQFLAILLVSLNIVVLIQPLSMLLMTITYLAMIVLGIILFIRTIIKVMRS